MFLTRPGGHRIALALSIIAFSLALSFPAGASFALCGPTADAGAPCQTALQSANTATTPVKVKLDKKSVKIVNDGKVRLTATVFLGSGKSQQSRSKISWRIENNRIARVSQSGVIQGKTSGTTRVTAETANGKKASAKVRVVIEKDKMASKIPILTYHRIASDKAKRMIYRDDSLAVSQSMFARQMRWLKLKGYRTISTAELRSWRVNATFLPKKSILITIDDGFYETYHVAYPILRKYGLKATSFVIGKRVKEATKHYNPRSVIDHYLGWDVIDEVRRSYPDLEFQSHTYGMHKRASNGRGVAETWSRAKIDADFAKNKAFRFSSMAYPFGHYSSTMIEAARAASIKMAFGYIMWEPATRTSPIYNMPRFKVMGDGSMSDFAKIARTAG